MKPIVCVAGFILFLRETARERGRDTGGELQFESQEFTDFISGIGSFQNAVGKVMYIYRIR